MRKIVPILCFILLFFFAAAYFMISNYRRTISAKAVTKCIDGTIKNTAPAECATDNQLAYKSLMQEYVIDKVSVKGSVPSWLAGNFYYNGPAQFELNGKPFAHTFDGFAMIHKFSIGQGAVSYTNKFLDTEFRQKALKEGKLPLGFVQEGGGSWKIVSAVSSLMSKPKKYDNANMHIMPIGNRLFALTETPHMIEFDPQTIKTIGAFSFDKDQKAHISTPHPLYDAQNKTWYNLFTQFGHTSNYHIYTIDGATGASSILSSISVDYPGYMHSFAITEHYIILIESPLVVNPYDFLTSSKPFIENFIWKPQQKSRFIIINKQTGKQEKIVLAPEAFFMFHAVDAYETNKEHIIIDIVTYPDIGIINSSSTIAQLCCSRVGKNKGILERFDIDLKQGIVTHPRAQMDSFFDSASASLRMTESPSPLILSERNESKDKFEHSISQNSLELPAINQHMLGKKYQFVYGLNVADSALLKIDLATNKIIQWQEQGCLVGQPVFIGKPKATAEDDGVILAVALDTMHKNSFLLILDAKNMEELARATLAHHIPLGFHAMFI